MPQLQRREILVDALVATFTRTGPAGACAQLTSLRRSTNRLKPSDTLDRWSNRAEAGTRQFLARHPKKITAAITVVLTGFAVTAFGIAPMMPDAANLPRRVVTEEVASDGVTAQLEALADQELQLYRNDLTRSSDTADTLLRRLNVDDPLAADFLRNDPIGRQVLEGRSGKMVRVRTGANGELEELIARYAATGGEHQAATRFTRLRIERVRDGLRASIDTAPLEAQVRMGSGTIRSSLFAATDDAGIPDAIASQLAEVFSTDIDFHRELRKGATFSVVYETLTADGEPIPWNAGVGRVLAAEFINDGKSFSAIWFKQGNDKGGYYNLDGTSKRQDFLVSPLPFSRVTSGFAMRVHPIFNNWKQHKGVDYGAPSGTPVRAVGDGEIDFAGWQNGYGNVVEIRHANGRSTLYAHLSRISVHKGEHVDQGDTIGNVGSTGWATGPHLHFEVKLAGVQQDPLEVAKASGSAQLSAVGRIQFAQLRRALKGQLEVAESVGRSVDYGE